MEPLITIGQKTSSDSNAITFIHVATATNKESLNANILFNFIVFYVRSVSLSCWSCVAGIVLGYLAKVPGENHDCRVESNNPLHQYYIKYTM